MSNSDELKATFFCVVAGVFYGWRGLKTLKLRRKMLDTPTSKISSAAMGDYVEVTGRIKANGEKILRSPLSKTRCTTYIWIIEKEIKNKNKREWIRVGLYYSANLTLIEDKYRSIAALDLKDLDLESNKFNKTIVFNSRSYKLPRKVLDILKLKKIIDIKKDNIIFSRKFRIRELVHVPGKPVYALGSARKSSASDFRPRTGNSTKKWGHRNFDEQKESIKFILSSSTGPKEAINISKLQVFFKSEIMITKDLSRKAWLYIILCPTLIAIGAWNYFTSP